MSTIILASGSPRRKQLLKQAEVFFEILVSDADESYPADMPMQQVPNFIAKQKANAVQQMTSDKEATIIAADTIVILNNEIIGKPVNEADAIAILQKLSGQKHQVITGVCIIKNNNVKYVTRYVRKVSIIIQYHRKAIRIILHYKKQ